MTIEAGLAACSVSVRGRDHVRAGLPNQDAGKVWRTRRGGMIAVADGLGSRPQAHLGARAAVLAAYRAVQAWQRQPAAGERELLLLIEAYWRLLVSPAVPDECASTLGFVAHFGEKLVMGSLGDALIVVQAQDEWITLDAPQNYLNQTLSLGTAHKLSDWQVRVAEAPSSLAMVATDGLGSDLDPAQVQAFLLNLRDKTRGLSSPEARKVLREVLARGPRNNDDKTLALMWSAT